MRRRSAALAAILGLIIPVDAARALPTGAQLVAGTASVSTPTPTSMAVNQTSDRAIVNWQSFNIGAAESVRFFQPGASSVALNRVLGADPSSIYGSLSANGQVFLVNPNGILFGPSARVDVGGLVASSLNISNGDFLAGKLTVSNLGNAGTVSNQGRLTSEPGGYVALIAPVVTNVGTISAPAGTVTLAAGDKVTLDFDGDNLLKVKVDVSAVNAQIANGGVINADGGRVSLTARAADGLLGSVINNSGTVSANSMVKRNGEIVLEGALVANSGSLDASGGAGRSTGGNIRVDSITTLNAGSLNVSGSSGGSIKLHASENIIETAAALVRANGSNGPGGSINYQGDGGVFTSGSLSATGSTGGSIQILGGDIKLAAASLDASGDSQGGTLLVGGDTQGRNPGVVNAKTTWINPYTTLKADAKDAGHGGKVIVWSENKTEYYGDISAKGGANSGDGGFIEVSGKTDLIFGGTASAAATNGIAGSLLLDPRNITISNAGVLPQYNFANPGAGGAFGDHILPLANGNVAVTDSTATVAGNTTAGAAYLFNGLSGALVGTITGTHVADRVGYGGATALTGSSNYVLNSYKWNGNIGAVTLVNGATGVAKADAGLSVSVSNSLVGSNASDYVGQGNAGFGVIALANGDYVVDSPGWKDGAKANEGAITLVNGTTGAARADATFTVSNTNSLVGAAAGDYVGICASSAYCVTVLANGNYVVNSYNFNNNRGAVTLVDGTTGKAKFDNSWTVSAANSLVGTNTSDEVGFFSAVVLANGNYVVASPQFKNGNSGAGAVTLVDGTTGKALANNSFTVSNLNSLVGTNANDMVGNGGVTLLSSGDYVVASDMWKNAAITWAGAVTLVNGASGAAKVGGLFPVSATNSLVGTHFMDFVGMNGITVLTSGDYVVNSANWNGFRGAVTLADGTTGKAKADAGWSVLATNSLSGANANDQVGYGNVFALTNGNYVVASPNWKNGANTTAGAVTLVDGATGKAKASADFSVTAANSLVGSNISDQVGLLPGVTVLASGDYVVASPNWMNGAHAAAGAVTLVDGTTGSAKIGGLWPVSAANSLVGSNDNDKVGGAVTTLASGNYLVTSTNWMNGANATAGALTWVSVAGQTLDGNLTITAQNSLVGAAAAAGLASAPVKDSVNHSYLAAFTTESGGRVSAAIEDPNYLTFSRATGQDMTITPAFLTRTLNAGTSVTLQASNDITVMNAIASSNAGAGGALTLQAGRSILLNANITTDNAAIALTANDTLAHGVVDADRAAGAAAITMATGTTLASGNGNITLTLGAGTGLTNGTSGNITVDNLTTTGHVWVANNGATAGSSILRAQASSLISASSAALDITGGGGGGSIGTSGNPLRVTVSNLEARSQSGGAFFSSPTLGVIVGGATLGGLTGISTTGNGDVTIAAAGALTQSEQITGVNTLSASGTSVTLNNGSNTITNLGATSSSAGLINILDSAGGLTVTGNVTATGGDITLGTTGALAINSAVNANNNTLNLTATGDAISQSAAITNVGTLNATGASVTLTTGGNTITNLGATSSTAGLINIVDSAGGLTVTGNVSATGGDITLATTGALAINSAVNANSNALNLTATGGAISQSAAITNVATLTATGASVTLNNNGNTITSLGTTNSTAGLINILDSAGGLSVTGNVTATGGDITLATTGALAINSAVNANNNALNLTATGGAISQSSAITNVATLTATGASVTLNNGGNTITNLGATSSTAGLINILDSAGGLTVTGNVSTVGGAATLTTTGALAINGTVDASTHALTLTATGGAISQSAAITNVTTLTTTGASVTLNNGSNTITSLGTTSSTAGLINIADSAGGLSVNGNVTATGGSLTLSTVGAMSVSGTIDGGGNAMSLTATGASGAITLASPITWSAGALSLNAGSNFTCSANLYGSGTASLILYYGQNAVAAGNASTYILGGGVQVNLPTGNYFSTKFGSDGGVNTYYVINSLGAALDETTAGTPATTLQGIARSTNKAGNYALGSNIDASGTSTWNSNAGFVPIGTGLAAYSGIFDGLGHTVTGLVINAPSLQYVGLFGLTNGATISNVGLVGGSIAGQSQVGGLIGLSQLGTINYAYSSASVSASSDWAGGLIGQNVSTPLITNSHASGNVTGTQYVGGLIGQNSGTLSYVYATGNVNSTSTSNGANIGGLIGKNDSSANVTNSYASGNVVSGTSGTSNATGGFVGYLQSGTFTDNYATGNVTGFAGVGGFAGLNTGTITRAYASGIVTGASNVGGFAGAGAGGTNTFWNSTANPTGNNGLGTALTAVQMQTAANFTNFTFTTTPGATGNNWVMVDANGSLNNAAGAAGGALPMLASEWSTYVTSAHQLQLMAMATGWGYTLGGNIDAAKTNGLDIWGGSSFVPVGNSGTQFSGTFDGKGYTINGLTINLPSQDYVGLFGYASSQTINNVGLVGGSITGRDRVGALAGNYFYGVTTISNDYSSATVVGREYVGGLIGYANALLLDNVYATGNVSSSNASGRELGGLIGYLNNGNITNAYASGTVNANSGAAVGNYNVGGLVGWWSADGSKTMTNVYAAGAVTGYNFVGGLIGRADTGIIDKTYASGLVTATIGPKVGGLIGSNSSTVTKSFYDWTKNNTLTGIGSTVDVSGTVRGMSTAAMQAQANFTGATGTAPVGDHSGNGNANPAWDFAGTWFMYDGQTYPLLRAFMSPITVTATADSKTYSGVAYAGGNGVSYSVAGATLSGTPSYSGSSQGAVNVGGYVITPSGLYSNQQGYIITYADGALNINKANLTLAGGRAYDGTTIIAGAALTATGVHGETFVVGGAGDASNLASKNVQVGSLLATVTGLSLGASGNGGVSGNYNALATAGSSVTITAAPLTVTAPTVVKTYDGGFAAAGAASVGALAGAGAGETVFTAPSIAFTDKNAGAGNKTVRPSGLVIHDGGAADVTANYAITYTDDIGSTINAKTVTLSAAKTYDGTTDLTGKVTVGTGVGIETLSYTGATANDRNVATAAKYIDAITLQNGTGTATNYQLPALNNGNAPVTINKADLALSGTRAYDGTTVVAGAVLTANGVNGETFTVTGLGDVSNMLSKNVQINPLASITGLALGAGHGGGVSGNYNALSTVGSSVTITAVGLQLLDLSGAKTYDGTPDFAFGQLTIAPASIMGGDVVSLASGSASVASKNAGHYAAFTANTLGLGGLDAANYSAVGGAVSVDITAKPVTLTAPAVSKTYDGTLAYSVSPADRATLGAGLVGGDTVSAATIAYTDKNFGVGNKVANLNAATILDGNGGANYTVTLAGNATSSINKAGLTLTAQTNSKTYDGTTSAAAVPLVAGLQLGDTVTGTVETYDNPNAGSGKTLSVSSFTVNDGNGGANYTVGTVNDLTGVINAAVVIPSVTSITGSFSAANKVYDGTAAATITARNLSGVIGADDVHLTGGTANFDNKNVGVAKLVTATGLYLTGAAAGNYTSNSTATTTADITARPLTVTAAGMNKAYDGTTAASVTLGDNRVAGDSLSTAYAAASFNTKDVGTAKPVTVAGISLSGADRQNYSLASNTATASADITARPLVVTATGANKVYGDADPALSYLAGGMGLVAGDAFFGTLARAPGESVAAYAINQGSLSAGSNYAIAYNGASLVITPAQLLYLADQAARNTGVANPLFTGSVTGFKKGETQGTAATGTLSFASSATPDAPVGSYAIAGAGLSAGNYVFAQAPANATALSVTAASIPAQPSIVTSTPPPVNPPAASSQLPAHTLASDFTPLERLLDPLVPCKSKMVGNDDGSFSISADCGG